MNESPYVSAASAGDFEEQVIRRSHEAPVLVDFWAAWCGPCRSLAPVLHEVVTELNGALWLVTVDTDQEMDLAAQYQIRSLPTVKLFKAGRVVDEFMGALPASQVRAFLAPHIERQPDPRLTEAGQRAQRGDRDGAAELFRQVLGEEPKNLDARLRWARMLLDADDPDGAAELLQTVPVESAREPEVLRLKALLELKRLIDPGRSDAEVEAEAAESSPAALRELAARKVLNGDYDGAMALQLELLKTNKTYADNAAQKDMLAVFELVDEPDLVNRYRRKMSSLLY